MLYNLSKILAGIALAFFLLAIGGLTIARYFIEAFTAPPPRPVFSEEVAVSPKATPSPQPSAQNQALIVASPPSPSPSVSPSPSPTTTPKRPDGKSARVSWGGGLMVRSTPDGPPVGGVDYRAEVVILETSADGKWQKIWSNGLEGWIKAGNVEMVAQ